MPLNTRQQIRLDKELLQWLKEEADERGMSWCGLVRWILEKYRIRIEFERTNMR